jgi:hypothetical protein
VDIASIGLVALKPLVCEGRSFARGDVFLSTPIQAAAMTFAQSARFAERHEQPKAEIVALPVLATEAMTPDPPVAPKKPARKSRTYRRRDMRAE